MFIIDNKYNNNMADVECVFESLTGKGSIYISNFIAASNISLLHSIYHFNSDLNIRAILSVARSGRLDHSKEDIPFYLYIPAHDHVKYELYRHFNQTFEFIDEARKHTNVLVHCMAGVSRSAITVMAYLLKKYKCSLSEVIRMVQRKRHKVCNSTPRLTPTKDSCNSLRCMPNRKDSSATMMGSQCLPFANGPSPAINAPITLTKKVIKVPSRGRVLPPSMRRGSAIVITTSPRCTYLIRSQLTC